MYGTGLIFTSSFAAVGHPSPSGPYTEDSWAYFSSSDDHAPHENWNMDVVRVNREIAYSKTKVDTEKSVHAASFMMFCGVVAHRLAAGILTVHTVPGVRRTPYL